MSSLLARPTSSTIPGRPPFRVGSFSVVWRPRALTVSLLLLVAIVLLAAVSIGLGDYPVPPARVLEVLFTGQGTRIERLVVLDLSLIHI